MIESNGVNKVLMELERLIKNKPPIGIVPKKIWLECRIKDLVKAIDRFLNDDNFNYSPSIPILISELTELSEIREKIK